MSFSKAGAINCKNVLADRKLVPDDQLKLFCQFLQDNHSGEVIRHPDGGYHIHKDYPQPHKLKFPIGKPDLITRKFFLPKQEDYTFLCNEHATLNADFVHQWFKFIQLEVGARLEILRASSREYVGAYAWDNVVKPLTRLHRIWMRDADVKKTFGKFCHEGFESTIDTIDVTYQEDGCEACILKRIGSHINTLHALRCIIKSRLSLESHAKHPRRLRLLRIVDPWIELLESKYGISEGTDQRKIQDRWITGLSEELYEKRKELELDRHRRRRAQRHLLEIHHSNSKKYKQYVKDLESSAIDGNFHDAENDIIDAYAALRASQKASVMASVDIVAGNILDVPDFPSYQTQFQAVPTEGNSSPYGRKIDKTYIESRYSIDTIRNNDRVIRGYTNHIADLPPSQKVGKYDIRDSAATLWPVLQTGSKVKLRDLPSNVGRETAAGGKQSGRNNDSTMSIRGEEPFRMSKSDYHGENLSEADHNQEPNVYYQSRFKEDSPKNVRNQYGLVRV